jgi:threonine/homoserine/homoserine lactone efflux protein
MSLPELAALLAYSTAMSFTPGPNTTLSTALAANGGLRHAMPFVLAVPFGWVLLLLASSLGLGAVITAQPALRGGLLALGACAMLWMAWKLGRRGEVAIADRPRLQVTFWQGVALQFVNIKAWLNALVISATWVAVEGELAKRLLLVAPIMMAYGLASNLSYALVGSMLRGWLAQGRRLLHFNRLMAFVLAATALWMLQA